MSDLRYIRRIFAAVIILMTLTVGVFADLGDTLLYQGITDNGVSSAKYYLGELGYLKVEPNYCNPMFDDVLQQAVETFQNDHQLVVDGLIGKNTAEQLVKAYNEKALSLDKLFGKTFMLGDKQEEVLTLKKVFAHLGFLNETTAVMDTTYDESLRAAVQVFQNEYGLEVDGIVGPGTLKTMDAVMKQQQLILEAGSAPIKAKSVELPDRGLVTRDGARYVATAGTMLGVPYVWAGASEESGFDCSGFTMWVMNQNGIQLPHSASAQFQYGTEVTDLRPGDLVFFKTDENPIGHVGIYAGNDTFIHASSNQKKRQVVVENFSNYIKYCPLVGARRFSK